MPSIRLARLPVATEELDLIDIHGRSTSLERGNRPERNV
jgi:hypothetical protein